MMKIKIFLLSIMMCLLACSSEKSSPTIRFPYKWLGTPGFRGDIDQQNIIEPSDICYHPLRKTLFVVSDEGEIFEMKTDGSPVSQVKIPGDLEGVTVDPQSGFLYIIVEGEDILLEFDPEEKEISRRFFINRTFQGDPNFLQKQQNHDNGI